MKACHLLLVLLLLASSASWAQSPETPAGQAVPPSAAQAQNPTPDDDLAQMKTDLNTMESLLNNMSSEITFLRDQNLQILLNTNGRMWTIVIRDMRKQIAREEQRREQEKTQPREKARTPHS
jgi:hypothetical protein